MISENWNTPVNAGLWARAGETKAAIFILAWFSEILNAENLIDFIDNGISGYHRNAKVTIIDNFRWVSEIGPKGMQTWIKSE
jgi:hypothetical protein